MPKIIVAIHGLANKPPKEDLAEFWRKSIAEGLTKNCGLANPKFDMRMVYWADLLYKQPLHDDDDFNFDKLYNTEPYTPGPAKLKAYREGFLDTVRAKGSVFAGASLDFLKSNFGMDSLADWALAKILKDLDFYYDDKRLIGDRSKPKKKKALARTLLQKDLHDTLVPAKGSEIMLIAHSMGTIISYDVLRDLGREDPGFEVSHFVTIGSPLGLPHVKAKIAEERAYDGAKAKRVRTPSIVTGTWKNYSDRRDPVALDTHLGDDYQANSRGVAVQDDLILNSYTSPAGGNNYHKSYGYLRTPELSKHIAAFLAG